MSRRGKSLSFTGDGINELVELQYGDKQLFALLVLLFPFVDAWNHFHIDHVFPKSKFTKIKLKNAGVNDDKIESFQEYGQRLAKFAIVRGA